MKKDTVLGLHARVAIDDERLDELIILAVVVRGRNPLDRTGVARPLAQYHGAVGTLDPLPPCIPVHRVIPARNRDDPHPLGQIAHQLSNLIGGGLRRHVAPVGDRMNHHRNVPLAQGLGRRDDVILMRMHPTGRGQSDQMRRALGLLQGASKFRNTGIFTKNEPSSIARSIWPKSIATTRPAPIFVWPTSELPICPVGKPTSGPWVISVACGQVSMIRS